MMGGEEGGYNYTHLKDEQNKVMLKIIDAEINRLNEKKANVQAEGGMMRFGRSVKDSISNKDKRIEALSKLKEEMSAWGQERLITDKVVQGLMEKIENENPNLKQKSGTFEGVRDSGGLQKQMKASHQKYMGEGGIERKYKGMLEAGANQKIQADNPGIKSKAKEEAPRDAGRKTRKGR